MVQAADCLRKVMDFLLSFHKDRAPRDNGYKKGALRCYKMGLGDLNMEQGEEYIQATKTIASLLHEREDFEEAKSILMHFPFMVIVCQVMK